MPHLFGVTSILLFEPGDRRCEPHYILTSELMDGFRLTPEKNRFMLEPVLPKNLGGVIRGQLMYNRFQLSDAHHAAIDSLEAVWHFRITEERELEGDDDVLAYAFASGDGAITYAPNHTTLLGVIGMVSDEYENVMIVDRLRVRGESSGFVDGTFRGLVNNHHRS